MLVREATFEDQLIMLFKKVYDLGMILFIVSEVMFFFAFFWAFFHSSIAPVYNIGGVWPPKAISTISTYTVPLTNTFILLTSGATVTWAHHALSSKSKKTYFSSINFYFSYWQHYLLVYKVLNMLMLLLILVMVFMVLVFIWLQDFTDFMYLLEL
jgi:flagellar biosynthesis protein FlhB